MERNSYAIQIKSHETQPMFNIFKDIIDITENFDRETGNH